MRVYTFVQKPSNPITRQQYLRNVLYEASARWSLLGLCSAEWTLPGNFVASLPNKGQPFKKTCSEPEYLISVSRVTVKQQSSVSSCVIVMYIHPCADLLPRSAPQGISPLTSSPPSASSLHSPCGCILKKTPKCPTHTSTDFIWGACFDLIISLFNSQSLSQGTLEVGWKRDAEYERWDRTKSALHGQQRGRRRRGKGLAVNTDGIIIWDSIVHGKASQRWSEEKKEKKASGEDNIWRGLSISPRHAFWVPVCFWGNYSDHGGVIWGKHRHQSPITCRRNANASEKDFQLLVGR